jgi:hypothetical protein
MTMDFPRVIPQSQWLCDWGMQAGAGKTRLQAVEARGRFSVRSAT